VADRDVPGQLCRRRRRQGTGPSAAAVITWAMHADPALRCALELAATRADTARARVRCFRRRCWACLALVMACGMATRALLWLLL
jgi:hypothetical protein